MKYTYYEEGKPQVFTEEELRNYFSTNKGLEEQKALGTTYEDWLQECIHMQILIPEREITKEQAQGFYNDLIGTVYGDSTKVCGGVMPVELIADRMGISFEKANDFCNAMIKYGITERQGGMIVV